MALQWPADRPRTTRPRRAAFGDHSIHRAISEIQAEVTRMGATDLRVDHNLELRLDGLPRSGQGQPDDRGVAVYFTLRGVQRVLCCDRWDLVQHNLWAIAKTIEAKRGVERWGAADVASEYAGYARLPAGTSHPTPERAPHEVLGVTPGAPAEVVKAAWRARSLATHPDKGGDRSEFEAVQRAYKALTVAGPETGRVNDRGRRE